MSISTSPFTSTRILLFFCCSNWPVLTPSVFKSKLPRSYQCTTRRLYPATSICFLYFNVDFVADFDAHVLILMHAEFYSRRISQPWPHKPNICYDFWHIFHEIFNRCYVLAKRIHVWPVRFVFFGVIECDVDVWAAILRCFNSGNYELSSH